MIHEKLDSIIEKIVKKMIGSCILLSIFLSALSLISVALLPVLVVAKIIGWLL
jgi:hypothetical protein